MSSSSDIYDRPDVYDLEYAGSNDEDVRFWCRTLTRLSPQRVVELACGAGRLTFALAAALPGAHIVGVDTSVEMIAHAADAQAAAPPEIAARVRVAEGDMRTWTDADGPCDAVLLAGCSASHLLTLDDRRRTWATAFRLLRPGGTFLLDVRSPDLATLAESQRVQPRAFVDLDIDATRQTPGEDARLLRCRATTYEPHLQRANVRLLYDKFDGQALTERFVTDFPSHIYFPAELALLFSTTGFETVRLFGDYSGGGFGRTSPFLITQARKPLA